MDHSRLFAFEGDFVDSLRCIPMAVRFKLDRSEIKLTLRQWSRFRREDRQELLEAPCRSDAEVAAYRTRLVELVHLRTREVAKVLTEPPLALWESAGEVAPVVTAYARTLGVVSPSNESWRQLSELQRFVLVKLTRHSHDNVNFIPAMREFGLLEEA
jgi:hypothetical protein